MRRSQRRAPGRYAVPALAAACLATVALLAPVGADRAVLAAGQDTFTISGVVAGVPPDGFPSATCGEGAAALVPGVERCLALTVDNRLDVPITVRTIRVALDPDFPAPPVGCRDGELALPSYSGSLPVPAGARAKTPVLPISLRDTDSNQDPCQGTMLHLAFSGIAERAGGATHSGGAAGDDLAFTGSPAVRLGLLGLALLLSGGVLVGSARRAARPTGTGRDE